MQVQKTVNKATNKLCTYYGIKCPLLGSFNKILVKEALAIRAMETVFFFFFFFFFFFVSKKK